MFHNYKNRITKTFKLMIKIYLFIFVFLLLKNPAFANHVDNIGINVVVGDTGKATITQTWQGTFDEGSEIYFPIEDKNLIVKDLKVWRNGRQYDPVIWNVDYSFDDKKWKCGINKTDKDVELCFGITEYGNNTYTFSYTVDPLVKSFSDYDGFCFNFLYANMPIYPTNVNFILSLENGRELTDDFASIWGFGFSGNAWIQDGKAVAFTNTSINGKGYFSIMLRLNKGMITPNVKVNSSFDDFAKSNMEGSSYAQNDLTKYILVGFGVIAIAIIFYLLIRHKKK